MYTMADLYGPRFAAGTPSSTERGSGKYVAGNSGVATIPWLGILLVLIGWRVLIELAEEV